jgi:amino acid transporter
MGEEVRDPARTIPRAVMLSVALMAVLYLTMNVAVIAVVPWREAMASSNVIALFMERLYGRGAAIALTCIVLWSSVACSFVMTLGYSRIPFAAARNGDFFRSFARLNPRDGYPTVSLATIGILTAAFCYLDLGDVVTAAVIVRVLVQFLGQIAALHVIRTRRPEVALPFRMWLYPLPSALAALGWLFVLSTSSPKLLALSGAVLVSGCLAFLATRAISARRREGATETVR